MKNLQSQTVRETVIKRIFTVQKEDPAIWGKMNAHQMLCHCSDQIRLSLGLKTAESRVSKKGELLKWLILIGMPAPKGKVETVKELKQGEGGTPPGDFDMDKNNLIDMIKRFNSHFTDQTKRAHPTFGLMNHKQWARLVYIHLNHHLKQFSK